MPYLIFLFICAVWSVSFMLMKKAAVVFSPAEVAVWRVVAGTAVLGILWAAGDRAWSLRRRDSGALAWVAIGGCAWPYFIQPWVIARQGSAFMALMVSFVPLLTILLSLPVLAVRPSRRQLVGVLGALVCLAALMWDGLQRAVPAIDLVAALSVPLGYATTNIIIRRHLAHASSLLVTMVAFALSVGVLTPAAWAVPSPPPSGSTNWSIAVVSLAFLGIIGTGIATFLFNKLIRDHGPLFAGMTTNLVPLGAVLIGWFDAEEVSSWQVTALVGIVAMVSLVQFRAATPVSKS